MQQNRDKSTRSHDPARKIRNTTKQTQIRPKPGIHHEKCETPQNRDKSTKNHEIRMKKSETQQNRDKSTKGSEFRKKLHETQQNSDKSVKSQEFLTKNAKHHKTETNPQRTMNYVRKFRNATKQRQIRQKL